MSQTSRIITILFAIVGAIGSLAFVLIAGQGSPIILLLLFAFWVLSPFLALVPLNFFSKHWSILTQEILSGTTFALTVSSLIIYGVFTLRPHVSKPTPVFLLVPFGSWLLLGIMISIITLISKRK